VWFQFRSKPRADFYAAQIPTPSDVLLLVEVSDSSLAFDQGTKRALYARHGVAVRERRGYTSVASDHIPGNADAQRRAGV
jgi:hypothetical protein